jgi:hypothetical protein
MNLKSLRVAYSAGVALLGLAVGAPVGAETLRITVTNDQPAGGFAFSPVWFGLHDGTHPLFHAGDNLKGTPLQPIAELANTGPQTAAFAGIGPETTVGSQPYLPGASVTGLLNVADPSMTRFLNLASMVVPSNDFFFGNDAAQPIALFNPAGQLINAGGKVTSTRTLQIFGAGVWDAGTEVDNINFGAAFIVGDNITDHVDENSTAQLIFGGPTDFTSYLNSILGKATPAGYDISHLISAADPIATIQIAPTPEPSSLVLAVIGLAAVTGITMRRLGSARAWG